MNGSEIEKIRIELGLSLAQFAQLLGVHATTVYRWASSGTSEVRLDPLHAALLQRAKQSLEERKRREREEWSGEIVKALLLGGTLAGLALLVMDALPKGIKLK